MFRRDIPTCNWAGPVTPYNSGSSTTQTRYKRVGYQYIGCETDRTSGTIGQGVAKSYNKRAKQDLWDLWDL